MKHTTKFFLLGTLTGILSVIILLAGIGASCYWLMIKPMQKKIIREMQPPQLPSTQQYSFDELELTTPAGEDYDTGGLTGSIVVLNVWATWCPPCVAELPNLISLKEKTQAQKDIIVLCVSNVDRDKQIAFIKAREYSQEIFVYSPVIMDKLGKRGIPITCIFDKSGIMVFHNMGTAKWDDDSVIQFLKQLAQD